LRFARSFKTTPGPIEQKNSVEGAPFDRTAFHPASQGRSERKNLAQQGRNQNTFHSLALFLSIPKTLVPLACQCRLDSCS
jgi:hypothetical protein